VSFGESFGLSGHLFSLSGSWELFPSLLSWQGDWCPPCNTCSETCVCFQYKQGPEAFPLKKG
jgi:hypothetical protein